MKGKEAKFKSKKLIRKIRIRAKLRKVSQKLRLSVFRSARHIYAQIIDDKKGHTLVAACDKEISEKNKKMTKEEKALAVGELLAQKAKKKKIKEVFFDRGGYKYHGRVKALADGARKGGLIF